MSIPKTEEEWKEQLKDAFYSGVRVGEMSEAGLEGKTDFDHWYKWKELTKN